VRAGSASTWVSWVCGLLRSTGQQCFFVHALSTLGAPIVKELDLVILAFYPKIIPQDLIYKKILFFNILLT
jgi:hypothetical protein